MKTFAVVRVSPDQISFRGPCGRLVTMADAMAEITALQKQYPHQEFALVGIVAMSSISERINIKPVTSVAPKRKANVVKLVQQKAGVK